LRGLSSIHLPPSIADRLPKFFFAPSERDRVGLFLSFGLNDAHLERFIAYLKKRKYMIPIWKNSKYMPEVEESAKQKGVILRKVWEEIKDEEGLGVNELHAPIPY
jgi:hypothetical protein